jgi:Holliday junction resolvase RusA-like endonuclease
MREGESGAGIENITHRQFIPVKPMGAVRTTQKQKYKDERYLKYAAYKQHIGFMARQIIKQPTTAPILAVVTFYMPTPNSWSQKKKEGHEGAIHTSKPDIDNLVKGLFDSLNKIAWKDDNQVYEVHSRKLYSKTPGIEFEIVEANLYEGQAAEKEEVKQAKKSRTKGGKSGNL